ncbi:hypothetical protein PAMP_002645 [Pampus punctatissimus]
MWQRRSVTSFNEQARTWQHLMESWGTGSLLRTADGVSRSRLGVQSGVSRHGDDQIVTIPLVPLETAPESMPVPTSSSSPAATAAGGSGPDRATVTGQVGQTSLRVCKQCVFTVFTWMIL